MESDLLQTIKDLVFYRIPLAVREDVVQDIALAVICGDIALEHIQFSLKQFIRKAFKDKISETLSLDRPLPGAVDKTLSRIVDRKGWSPGDRGLIVNRRLHRKKRELGIRGSLLYYSIDLPPKPPSPKRYLSKTERAKSNRNAMLARAFACYEATPSLIESSSAGNPVQYGPTIRIESDINSTPR